MQHLLDQLVGTRTGRNVARALHRVGVIREAIDDALAREITATIGPTAPPRLRLVTEPHAR